VACEWRVFAFGPAQPLLALVVERAYFLFELEARATAR
jgi:hypothetical protein